ncbi:tetrathionate reductase family octaheme c-type cytochrome [Geoalkalibacter sp.]|uniref:tetrathionate reductase family octaheme c-type cytochrome n=1 Tax=Geoalkalibacter sp. TaxID=3041440 RepID=UPI00272EA83B|nr:tetrathionate reductase family octaheme c-type cytochrome [Geoalkalibacter sp.]
MKRWILGLLALGVAASTAWATPHREAITEPLADGRAATRECLKCHEDAAESIMRTNHWTLAKVQTLADGRQVELGKKNVLNNYCGSIKSNWARCTSCHIGYGWVGEDFALDKPENVDCLVCHDTTGTYRKDTNSGGEVFQTVNILRVAQNVGAPTRDTCGACHFAGGGGDGVKHGDMDSSLAYPERQLDVHMATDGLDFTCQQCHVEGGHKFSGRSLTISPAATDHFGCEKCHEGALHSDPTLDRHAARVACQTCHIPAFAREVPTKMAWDWMTGGRDDLAEKHSGETQHGRAVYTKGKGHAEWGLKVVPAYAWYNGRADAYLVGDKIDPATTTVLNAPHGSRTDPAAKIFPFKVHKGRQPYDLEHRYLLPMHTTGAEGFWTSFDWEKTLRIGAEAFGLTYSGKFGAADTESWWKVNHMVAPKEKALKCLDCHGETGRLDWQRLGYEKDPMNKI